MLWSLEMDDRVGKGKRVSWGLVSFFFGVGVVSGRSASMARQYGVLWILGWSIDLGDH